VRLWTNLKRFAIHLVSAADYWPIAEGIGPSRQDWWHRTWGKVWISRSAIASP
jgi:hypothetical protein